MAHDAGEAGGVLTSPVSSPSRLGRKPQTPGVRSPSFGPRRLGRGRHVGRTRAPSSHVQLPKWDRVGDADGVNPESLPPVRQTIRENLSCRLTNHRLFAFNAGFSKVKGANPRTFLAYSQNNFSILALSPTPNSFSCWELFSPVSMMKGGKPR